MEAWAQQYIPQPISSLPSRWIRLQAQYHPIHQPSSSSSRSSIHWPPTPRAFWASLPFRPQQLPRGQPKAGIQGVLSDQAGLG